MADSKISQLTAAAAVAGTNEFEINEAGTSKKATASQISTFVQVDANMPTIGEIIALYQGLPLP